MDARLRASSESHASICHRPSPRRRCSEASAGTRRRSARTSSGSCRRARDTSTVDFGDPLTSYALCVYDQSGAAQPLLRAAVPGGGTCAGAPCWEALDEGFRYRDPTLALEGIETIDLTGGERTGQSSLLMRARGPVFVPPA